MPNKIITPKEFAREFIKIEEKVCSKFGLAPGAIISAMADAFNSKIKDFKCSSYSRLSIHEFDDSYDGDNDECIRCGFNKGAWLDENLGKEENNRSCIPDCISKIY